ncbi:MAG: transposase, partial [Bacteroidota bacterium]|nr:transposase [Bacteroidota bacterium]
AKNIIDNYNNLWQIEKAFRISKTDLKVRPIYHRIRHRIEAHICIAFVAYTVIKELERRLKLKKVPLSTKRVAELSQTIYAINAFLPESNKNITVTLQMTDEQKLLNKILNF